VAKVPANALWNQSAVTNQAGGNMGARYSSEVGRPKQINCSNQFPTSRVRLADWAIGGDLSPVGVLFLIELPEREPNSTERQRTPRNGKFSQLPTGPTAAQPSSLHMFQPQRVIVLLVWSALPPGQRKFCFARCCQQLFASIFTTRFLDGTQTGKAIPFTEEVPPFVPTPVDNLGLLPI